MPLSEALKLAQAAGLDLVQVSADNDATPVCKLIDYHKFVYRQAKQLRKQRASQRKSEIKGIRIGFSTASHDLDVKAKKARDFLAKGSRVKVVLMFRGREITHFNLGSEKMQDFLQRIADAGEAESALQKQGKTISVLIKPIQGTKKSKLDNYEAEDTQRDQKKGQDHRQEEAQDA